MKTPLLALCLLVCSTAFAQYNGPAVETCREYAKRELKRDGTTSKDVVIERDRDLLIARYTRKLGSQFVSSVLTGNAALVLDGVPSAEMSFICLLADDKRALFFEWLPGANVSALAQCSRDGALRAKPRSCLDLLLQVAENDLTLVYAQNFQEARERDHRAGNEALLSSFRKSNDEWRQYRDAECVRRRDYAPDGVAPDDAQLACLVELTRRRALDMK